MTRNSIRFALLAAGLALIGLLLFQGAHWRLHSSRYSMNPTEFTEQRKSIHVGLTKEEAETRIQGYNAMESVVVPEGHPHAGQTRVRYLLRATPEGIFALDRSIDLYLGADGRVASVDSADL